MDKKYYLWLIMAFGEGSRLITDLLERFGSAVKVYEAFRGNRSLAGREAAEKAAAVTPEQAEELQEKLEGRGIHIIPITDMFYPKPLKLIENPPCVLFARGNYRLLSGKLLSTAGSRDITPYTVTAQEKLCTRLSRRYTLVSTLSYGCDQLTCICAVKNRRPCVEILPCGFDHEYPDGSRVLRELIYQNGGCIITEYLPEVRPSFASFRQRARIVGGISRALTVFQAGTQSGALTAARYAGNVFFLPPHNIFAKQYAGTAAFVRAGAGLIFDEKDLLPAYKGEYEPSPITSVKRRSVPKAENAEAAVSREKTAPALSEEQFDSPLHCEIYKKIADSNEPPVFDLIYSGVSCGIAELNEILLDLELSGLIRPLTGGRYEAL